jgi:hypothetical protein
MKSQETMMGLLKTTTSSGRKNLKTYKCSMRRKEIENNKLDKKTDKSSKSDNKTRERLENAEDVEIDGDTVTTFNVPRGDETYRHA